MKPYRGFILSLLATLLLVILLCGLNYLVEPTHDTFMWSSFNPLYLVNGLAFFLSFGLGSPILLSYLFIFILLGGIWLLLYSLVRAIVRMK